MFLSIWSYFSKAQVHFLKWKKQLYQKICHKAAILACRLFLNIVILGHSSKLDAPTVQCHSEICPPPLIADGDLYLIEPHFVECLHRLFALVALCLIHLSIKYFPTQLN